MDPYLEEPDLWPSVHTSLIVTLQNALVPLLRPKCYVVIELRVYDVPVSEIGPVGAGDVLVARSPETAGGRNGHRGSNGVQSVQERASGARVLTVRVPQPVEVRERYLEIRRTGTRELVTVIEILSPTNKRPGKGRRQYEEKRAEVTSTLTNLVEIDLLRAGTPLPVLFDGAPLARSLTGDYRILISRGHKGHLADLYTVRLREHLPSVPVPLQPGDQEPLLNLQETMDTMYDRGGLDQWVDYRQEPVPPLTAEDAA
jgi:hypothetical protein